MNFIKNSHDAKSLLPIVDPALISSQSTFFGILKAAKIAIINAPIGIKIFDTKKSAASKMMWPKIVMSPSIPKDKADGIPTIKIRIPVIHVTFFLFVVSPFVTAATIISNIENADVKVANKNNNKNTIKKITPNGIWSKTAGRTMNNNPGPSVGSKPNEKTAGKIANPAKIEIKTFINTIVVADFGKSSFFDKYEL